jgi:hypothetical protein
VAQQCHYFTTNSGKQKEPFGSIDLSLFAAEVREILKPTVEIGWSLGGGLDKPENMV